MENIIIECSRFDAINPISNASWTTNIPKGVTINEGDIITIRNCFINSNTSDAENIEISEDLNLEFIIGYYDVNYGTLSSAGADNIDYDFYIAYNENIGSVAQLVSVTFKCEYDDNVPTSKVLNAIIRFNDNTGKGYTLCWGVNEPPTGGIKMPDVPVPRPAVGNDTNVTAPVNYNNVVVSSLTTQLASKYTLSFAGANWAGIGQGGLSLNTGYIEVAIPKGEYTRTGIAKLITDELQLSPPMFLEDNINIGNDMLRRTDQGENHIGFEDNIVNFIGEMNSVELAQTFADENAVLRAGLDFDKEVKLSYYLEDPDTRITVQVTIESDGNGGIVVDNAGHVTIRFTQNIFEIGDIYRMGMIIVGNDVVFKRVGFDPTQIGTKNYNYPNPAYYGSSENVLNYDQDRSIFTWQYLHMPYFAQNPPTISIRQEKNTTALNNEAYDKYYTITQLGGVFFIALNPISFWERLGFTQDQLIVPIQPNLMINRMDLSERITRGYSSLASLLDLTNPKEVNLNIAVDIATTDTIQIEGSSLDDESTGGFYLIDVNFGGQNYMFQKGNKNSIQAIVGKYNQIRDYITGYSDSSIGYQHVGVPFDLQTINVNILDPETKLPDPDIGEKSTVFIQITRNPQPVNVKK